MGKATPSYIAELIGVFILTFIGAGSICINSWIGQPGLLGIALAHGLALSIVVTATMNISGGHINPAVSIAMWSRGRLSFKDLIGYIVAQLLGASLAGWLLCAIFGGLLITSASGASESVAALAKLGTPNFDPTLFTPLKAIMIEAVLTGILVFAIFGTAVDERAPKIGGFGIGLAVAFDILAGGPLTGAAMNPARTFGTLLGGCHYTSSLWSQHWVYWVGPVLGAVGSAWIYEKLILKKN
jgi:aquaporin Z